MENVNIYKIRYKIRSIWEIKGTKEAGENTLKNFKSQKSFILIIAHEYKNRDFHLLVLFSQRIFTPGCPLSPKNAEPIDCKVTKTHYYKKIEESRLNSKFMSNLSFMVRG